MLEALDFAFAFHGAQLAAPCVFGSSSGVLGELGGFPDAVGAGVGPFLASEAGAVAPAVQ